MNIKKIVVIIFLLFLLVFSGCVLAKMGSVFVNTFKGTEQPTSQYATIASKATKTATPFLPMGATPTVTNTIAPTITFTPTVTPSPLVPEGQVNIMVLGNDYRESSGYRTDVMMLVSINTIEKIVNVISFPRDLYVAIPGHGNDRLNTAMPYGGFSLLQQTMQINFNIKPDFYIMTNFNGFANIINSMGGIDVNASANLTDSCDLPQAVDGRCSAGPGIVHMNGETALWYVRSRYTSNDFDRNRRQQEVAQAILKNFLQFDIVSRASDLYNSYRNSVETDIDLDTIINLVPVAVSLNEEGRLNRYTIDNSYTSDYWTDQGAAVLLPDHQKIQDLILEVIYRK